MPVVVGVDSSTSGCKVEVRDAGTGALVASGRAAHPRTTPPRSEQDPMAWWTALEKACAAAGVPDIHQPAAIAVAGQQHGMVVLDADHQVLRPAKLWNDTESAPDAQRLVDELGPAQWAEACGSVPVASFTVTKLAWLARTEPSVFARVAHVALPHDWLTMRLCGRLVTDRGDASGTGWWSPAQGRYRPDLLAMVDDGVDWVARLPEVLGPTEVAGHWNGAVVAPGTGDNMAAALGLGLGVGDLAVSLGTSGTAYSVSGQPVADPTGVVAGFADAAGRYLPLVCTLNATKVTDAVAGLMGVDPEGLDALALAAQPGADGLVLVPHLDGERTPNRPGATGTLCGLRTDVTRPQLARAAVEGVVCNLLVAAAAIPDVDPAGRLFLVGGGARSAAYRRVVADVTGRTVTVPDADELVALGAAVQAAATLADCPPPEVAAQWGLAAGTVVEPDASVDGPAMLAAFATAVAATDRR